MAKLTGILGLCALVFAIVDLIHGHHNGDAHGLVIHVVEFTSFFGFLCLLDAWAFKAVPMRFNLNRWLATTFLSLLNFVFGFILFIVSGGGFHGDGGPIAFSFFLIGAIGEVILPVSFIGFVVVAISRKRNGLPVLDR
ncbi:MAG TPA: hypothetical protein VFA99_12815 [Acidobacteriaceae bacterium]|nr:hypothetical protein [Acidobacteriaceae bacterium]